MKKINTILLVIGLALPFFGSAQTQRIIFSQGSSHFYDKIDLKTGQNEVNLPRYLENLDLETSVVSFNSNALQMSGKAYHAYFNNHLLNYEKFLKNREITELLLPNRNYTGGHLADNYTWDKVFLVQRSY